MQWLSLIIPPRFTSYLPPLPLPLINVSHRRKRVFKYQNKASKICKFSKITSKSEKIAIGLTPNAMWHIMSWLCRASGTWKSIPFRIDATNLK